MTPPHDIVHPEGMPAAVGFSHGVSAPPGRSVHVAGQIGDDVSGRVVAGGLVAQFDAALGNVVGVLRAAAAAPGDVVSMTVYTTDLAGYREARSTLGAVWRRHMGRHYPAMALVGVAGLVDPEALVEISAVAIAVLPNE